MGAPEREEPVNILANIKAPCPNCRSVRLTWRHIGEAGSGSYSIFCLDCCHEGRSDQNLQIAIAFWNKKASEQ